jgi:hypothetical protein
VFSAAAFCAARTAAAENEAFNASALSAASVAWPPRRLCTPPSRGPLPDSARRDRQHTSAYVSIRQKTLASGIRPWRLPNVPLVRHAAGAAGDL